MIEQFIDGGGGRQRRVVAQMSSGIRNQQPLARGQNQVEKWIALFLPPLPVAGAGECSAQIEFIGVMAARQRAVVHSKQADDPVREAAQTGGGARKLPPRGSHRRGAGFSAAQPSWLAIPGPGDDGCRASPPATLKITFL